MTPLFSYRGACRLLVLGLAGLFLAPASWAQILIGKTADFSSISATGVRELTDGARLWLDAVNGRGGVHGQKIELITMDDRFEPQVSVENARKLIVERQVIAMFLTRGTPHAQALLPLLAQHKVPLVGPSTGAMSLHEPLNRYVFNVRSTYQREAEMAVSQLKSMGLTRIALLNVDDPFGNDAATGALKGFDNAGFKPVLAEKFPRVKPDFAPISSKIAEANPQAIVFIGTNLAVADGVRQIRDAGSHAQIVTLSNNASGGFVKALGANARGTVVTQVFPSVRALGIPMIRALNDLAAARKLPVSPMMLEGFAAARVLVEGLRRAGGNPTSESLMRALEGMRSFDLGGMELGYSPTDHSGLDFADLSIIDAQGKFRR